MPQSNKANGTSVRLPAHSAALLDSLLLRANTKDFGRRITAGEIVGEALKMIKERHIADLQEASQTQDEKFAALYARYCRTENISKEQFFDKLMSGEIPKGVLKTLHDQRHEVAATSEMDPKKRDGADRSAVL